MKKNSDYPGFYGSACGKTYYLEFMMYIIIFVIEIPHHEKNITC